LRAHLVAGERYRSPSQAKTRRRLHWWRELRAVGCLTIAVVWLAVLFVGGSAGLVSYARPVGLTLQSDNQGDYVGVYTLAGWLVLHYSAVIDTATIPVAQMGRSNLFVLGLSWSVRPKDFVTREITYESGQFTERYVGLAPSNAALREIVLAIHGAFLVGISLSVMLLVGREPYIRWRRRRNNQCPTCGYDRRGNTSSTCPECGTLLNTGPSGP
jgi:hypothetical protein